jgi:hypothetical protein
LLDEERGRLSEQIRQLERIEQALAKRDELSEKIDALSAEIQQLESQVAAEASSVRHSQSADVLASGINSYLNSLNAGSGPPRWSAGRVDVEIREREVRFNLNGRDWKSEVGGTFTCFFLAAYQYALLQLSAVDAGAYPGLAIIDLPANVSDNRILDDAENYLVEPFIELCSGDALRGAQLIISGHAYAGLVGVHRVQLARVYNDQE